MSKKFIWLSAIAFVLSLGQPSYACSGDSKQCQGHHKFDTLAQELDLTANQKAQIKAYKKEARASYKEHYAKLRSLRNQVNSLVQSDKIDESKLDNLVEQINTIRGSMLKSRIMMQHKLYTLLNEKQKAKFLELKKKWYEHHNG